MLRITLQKDLCAYMYVCWAYIYEGMHNTDERHQHLRRKVSQCNGRTRKNGYSRTFSICNVWKLIEFAPLFYCGKEIQASYFYIRIYRVALYTKLISNAKYSFKFIFSARIYEFSESPRFLRQSGCSPLKISFIYRTKCNSNVRCIITK